MTSIQIFSMDFLLKYMKGISNPVAKGILGKIIMEGEVKILKDVLLDNVDDLNYEAVVWVSDDDFSIGRLNDKNWYNDIPIQEQREMKEMREDYLEHIAQNKII